MASKKSASSATKSVTSKPKTPSKPAAKPALKKPAAATKTKASKDRVNTSEITVPRGREHDAAEKALQVLDQASDALRTLIRTGAATTAKSRIAAQKRATSLIDEASSLAKNIIGRI